MNIIFKMMFFGLLLNASIGIMTILFPDMAGLSPQPYDSNQLNMFTSGMNNTIDPVPDSSNTFFRLIDSLNIGLIGKFLSTIDTFLFGFLNFMNNLFHIDTGIMIILKSLMSVSYILGGFWLWTGKNLTSREY